MIKSSLTAFLLLSSLLVSAQSFRWDIGVNGGIANYFGDLASEPGTNSLKVYQKNTRYSFGGFARLRAAHKIGVSFHLNYILIAGADSLNKDSDRTSRNLSFRNNMFEGSARLEFYPVVTNDLGGKKRYTADLHLMLFGGLGLTYSNPQASLNGSWENLRPIQTEGVRYSALQPVIPLGFGAFSTFRAGRSRFKRHRLGVEVNWRLTFTDYLDDVSTSYVDNDAIREEHGDVAAKLADRRTGGDAGTTGGIRGNPNKNDNYATIMFSYSYLVGFQGSNFRKSRYNYGGGRKRRTKF
jgi:hypothetical protein